jgi:hypothetical protein
VLNLDFDYVRYLDVLRAHGFNLTRTFSGTYRELPGSFGITGNTLAPAPGRYACPWARSSTPGAVDGGNQFDLTRWDPAYFDRLKDFVAQAGKRRIVVELVLFCTMYDDQLWQASPMNVRNNTGGIGQVGRQEVYSAQDRELLAVQQAVVRKIVTELRDFDNLYYEVCNEPYERPGLTREWNDRIVATLVEAEAPLPAKHLIAQNVALGAAEVEGLNEHVSVVNFHAATPDSVRLNYHLKKVIACDETGGSERSDRKYRTEGWHFILAGGGGLQLRRQLQILEEFIEGFDFIQMASNHAVVKERQIQVPLAGAPPEAQATVQVLAEVGLVQKDAL